jgi:hypothetical protein
MTLNRGAKGRARALPPPPLQGAFFFGSTFWVSPVKGKKTNVENHL